MMDTTLDGLLDRRVTLEQPKDGFRVAVDTVLLAASVPAQAGDAALDLGCGAGGAMLCLACRAPDISVTGVEIQDELIELCRRNIARNALPAKMDVMRGDAAALPPELSGAFDHVLMNPPYHDEARHDVSPHAGKRAANSGKTGDPALWIAGAARALKPAGMLTLIHRADRLPDLLLQLEKFFGAAEVVPVLPRAAAPPKRAVIRARKGETMPPKVCRPFILHNPDGGYTAAAEAVLRGMKALEFPAQ